MHHKTVFCCVLCIIGAFYWYKILDVTREIFFFRASRVHSSGGEWASLQGEVFKFYLLIIRVITLTIFHASQNGFLLRVVHNWGFVMK